MFNTFKYVSKLVLVLLILFLVTKANAAVYEASTLHNAVSRSETVQNLFAQRWEQILENSLCFDIYGKINWVKDFQINTYNRGTGKKEAIDMTLVRTYGSVTFNYPLLGEFNMKERFTAPINRKSESVDGGGESNEAAPSLWKKDNVLIGFTMTGFHYGLTREANVDRGSAGNEDITDYKYTQFFDDIFAISILYVPYVYIHTGIIINNQIEPNDDGTMAYGSSGNSTKKYFLSSNVLSFLNANAATTTDMIESISFDISINGLVEGFSDPLPAYFPDVTIGYKYLKLYNDEAYDSVWVGSAYQDDGTTLKTSFMDNSEQDESALQTITLNIKEDYKNILIFDLFTEFQRINEDIYDKRNNKKIDPVLAKEIRGMLGFNLFGFSKKSIHQLIFSYGLSRYWDPAIAVHRDSGYDYNITGWIFSIEWNIPWGGIDFKVNKNYSDELRKLAEATDKYSYETSLFFRF